MEMLIEPEHILHVEDSDEDAALIAHLLRRFGVRLSRVRTYGEMIEYSSDPDVVLLDLRIPGSNNPLRLVADAARRFRNAGLILLTGISDREGEELSVRAMAEGAQVRLVKDTFDGRHLWLSIREAYQQRQHMIRTIRESRSDMRVDPHALQESFKVAFEQDMAKRFGELEHQTNLVLRKLRKLGAEDTSPIRIDGDNDRSQKDPDSEAKRRFFVEVFRWALRHERVLLWLALSAITTYFAVSDYVTGLRNAVMDTNERVRQIDERLREEGEADR